VAGYGATVVLTFVQKFCCAFSMLPRKIYRNFLLIGGRSRLTLSGSENPEEPFAFSFGSWKVT
jgi:hypothetical protein